MKVEEAIKLLRGNSASCQIWSRKNEIADLIEQQQKVVEVVKEVLILSYKALENEVCNGCNLSLVIPKNTRGWCHDCLIYPATVKIAHLLKELEDGK
ncbi:hypothetical protein Ga0466249_002257 [Sporomusaceae bacterium BoRhaA]|uniref:hypothetical protein n=1 Tax=Pelorhabdus rhamnosifermentans TaxID=2772457 RepID=UPI001C06374D|nr:hypothetical protein [Pelorhabdus rhamnosifermentans]MBU2701143.1 hypothetical protein [Pelorhabdus rhamnosifermentans]